MGYAPSSNAHQSPVSYDPASILGFILTYLIYPFYLATPFMLEDPVSSLDDIPGFKVRYIYLPLLCFLFPVGYLVLPWGLFQ